MANNLTAYTNYTSGVDISVGLIGKNLGPSGRDVFSGLNLASAITTAAPSPWNGLTFHWDTSNLASQKLYVKGTPSTATPAAGNWREMEVRTAGGERAIFKYRLRVSRDAGDGSSDEIVHGWDEFNHVSVRTKGDTARVDAGLSMVGVKLALSMNGVNGSSNVNGLNLGLNITAINLAVSYTAAADVRFNYAPFLEVTSTHYPSGVLPQFAIGRAPAAPGDSKFWMPTLRVGRRISKTKFPPIQLTFNQAHNFLNSGSSEELNTGLYAPTAEDYESVLGLNESVLLGKGPIGMRSPDAAYGAPPRILVDLKNIWESVLGNDVAFPAGGNNGVKKQADFISPIAKYVNLETFAQAGGTCNFIFSAGASQTFQFRSATMRTFTFGGGTTHNLSPIREMYHELHSVMAEKDLLLVKSHATYHYQCLQPLKGSLINKTTKKFDEAREGEKGMVNYRYEGEMRMSYVKVDGAGDSKTVKDIASIQMGEKNGVRMLSKKISLLYHSKEMEPGEVSPDDEKTGSLKIDDKGVVMQGAQIKLMDKTENASIVMKNGDIQILGNKCAMDNIVRLSM